MPGEPLLVQSSRFRGSFTLPGLAIVEVVKTIFSGESDQGWRNTAAAERPPLRAGDLSRLHRAWSGREKPMGEPFVPLPLMARVTIFLRPVGYQGMGRMIG